MRFCVPCLLAVQRVTIRRGDDPQGPPYVGWGLCPGQVPTLGSITNLLREGLLSLSHGHPVGAGWVKERD